MSAQNAPTTNNKRGYMSRKYYVQNRWIPSTAAATDANASRIHTTVWNKQHEIIAFRSAQRHFVHARPTKQSSHEHTNIHETHVFFEFLNFRLRAAIELFVCQHKHTHTHTLPLILHFNWGMMLGERDTVFKFEICLNMHTEFRIDRSNGYNSDSNKRTICIIQPFQKNSYTNSNCSILKCNWILCKRLK